MEGTFLVGKVVVVVESDESIVEVSVSTKDGVRVVLGISDCSKQ